MDEAAVLQFLIDFGYLPVDAMAPTAEAIAKAQVVYGLEATGVVDEMTARMWMRIPRCGFTDAKAVGFNRWGIKELTYFVAAYPVGMGLTKADYDGAVRAALDSWSAVCDLTFSKADDANANLLLSTGRGARANFDGKNGTLAYAYLPQGDAYRGQLRMFLDLDEAWSLNPQSNGILVTNVLAHELGHNLGLDHTNVGGSLMTPTYNPRIAKPQADDIRRVVDRYGKPVATTPAPTPVPPGLNTIKIEALVGNKVFAGTLTPKVA